jgi:hypothetical protein
MTAGRAKRENGGLSSPRKYDVTYPAQWKSVWDAKDLLVPHRTSWGILPQTPVFSLRSACCPPGRSDPDVQPRQLWSCTSDSALSEARKRGSGGGSPRKYDLHIPRNGRVSGMLLLVSGLLVPCNVRRRRLLQGVWGAGPPGRRLK